MIKGTPRATKGTSGPPWGPPRSPWGQDKQRDPQGYLGDGTTMRTPKDTKGTPRVTNGTSGPPWGHQDHHEHAQGHLGDIKATKVTSGLPWSQDHLGDTRGAEGTSMATKVTPGPS